MTKKDLYLFLMLNFIVWCLVPLFRQDIPMDSAETLVWGQEWLLGTNKHPPLSAWLSEIFFQGFLKNPISVYVLSQVCVFLGLYFIYKIASSFLVPAKAIFSVLLLEGTIYYSICSIEYNVNVLSLAMAPMTIYAFYKAVQKNTSWQWVLFGVLSALLMLTKYTNGFILLGILIYMLYSKEGKQVWHQKGFYLSIFVGIIVLLPHLLWLIQHDFYVLDYYLMRSGVGKYHWYNHFIYPFKFLGAQLLACLITLLLWASLFLKHKTNPKHLQTLPLKQEGDKSFLFCIGIVPLILAIALSLIMGIQLKSMWGYALLAFIPCCLFYYVPIRLSKKKTRRLKLLVYATLFGLAFSSVGVSLFHISKKANFPGKEFAKEMNAIWEKQYHQKLSFIGGDIWLCSNLNAYLKARPQVLIAMDFLNTPWIDEKDFMKKGALVLADNLKEYQAYQIRFVSLSEPYLKEITYHNILGKTKKQTIYYGFIEP